MCYLIAPQSSLAPKPGSIVELYIQGGVGVRRFMDVYNREGFHGPKYRKGRENCHLGI